MRRRAFKPGKIYKFGGIYCYYDLECVYPTNDYKEYSRFISREAICGVALPHLLEGVNAEYLYRAYYASGGYTAQIQVFRLKDGTLFGLDDLSLDLAFVNERIKLEEK